MRCDPRAVRWRRPRRSPKRDAAGFRHGPFHMGASRRFHEWRKRVKYLWYHLRILVPSWPDILKPWAATQHDLADLLGDGNDLTDLLALMAEESELVPDPDVASVLDGLARARRQALWEAARPLGRRLYSEEPGAFVARLADYWDGKSPVEPGDLQIGT